MTDSVQLYGVSFSTFVRAAALVCEEKAIDYAISQQIGGHTIDVHSPQHYQLHPFGKMPVLIHGDITLAETASIVRYLDRAFGPQTLQGTDDSQRALIDQWCELIARYVDEAIVRHYMLELAMPSGPDGQPNLDKLSAGRDNAASAVALLAKQLGSQSFLVGESFTLADAMVAPMLAYNLDAPEPFNLVGQHDNLKAYTQRLIERPSGRRVLKPLSESL